MNNYYRDHTACNNTVKQNIMKTTNAIQLKRLRYTYDICIRVWFKHLGNFKVNWCVFFFLLITIKLFNYFVKKFDKQMNISTYKYTPQQYTKHAKTYVLLFWKSICISYYRYKNVHNDFFWVWSQSTKFFFLDFRLNCGLSSQLSSDGKRLRKNLKMCRWKNANNTITA